MGVSFSCQYTNFPRKWSHSAIILFCARVAEWQTRWSQKPLSKRRVSSNLTSGTTQKAKTPSNGSLSYLLLGNKAVNRTKNYCNCIKIFMCFVWLSPANKQRREREENVEQEGYRARRSSSTGSVPGLGGMRWFSGSLEQRRCIQHGSFCERFSLRHGCLRKRCSS